MVLRYRLRFLKKEVKIGQWLNYKHAERTNTAKLVHLL